MLPSSRDPFMEKAAQYRSKAKALRRRALGSAWREGKSSLIPHGDITDHSMLCKEPSKVAIWPSVRPLSGGCRYNSGQSQSWT
jgi:hypothetical protein